MSVQARPFSGAGAITPGGENTIPNLEAEIRTHESSACGGELHRWRDPHPRVTAVAKKSQPPRRLPSPATERARDLKRALTKQGQPLYLGARIFRQPSSRDTEL